MMIKPNNWKEKSLKELCGDFKKNIVDGPFGSDLKRSDYTNNGIQVLKIQNIKENGINDKKLDYVTDEKYQELKRHSFIMGDIIMTKLGDPLGVCAIVKDIEKGIIVADLVRVRPVDINTEYLNIYLNSPVVRQYLNSNQKGTTRPRVKLTLVRDLPIIYPSLEVQTKIVERIAELFSVIDHSLLELSKVVGTFKEINSKVSLLKKSILKQAFEGKLV